MGKDSIYRNLQVTRMLPSFPSSPAGKGSTVPSTGTKHNLPLKNHWQKSAQVKVHSTPRKTLYFHVHWMKENRRTAVQAEDVKVPFTKPSLVAV